MAVNPRFEISSSNPDGVQFVSGYSTSHRSHFSGGPSLERSASFRETYEGRSLAQGGGNSGFPGSNSSGHGDLAPLSQVLSLDPVALGEEKYARQLELRRATNAALGASVDDSLPGNVQTRSLDLLGPEELKRVKASIYDNLLRARERSRLMADAIFKLDKYRSSMHFRKRARPEPSLHEKPITSLSVERSAAVGNSLKICSSPNHGNTADATLKLEDKNKGAVPNKRVRTSMADVRLEGRANSSSVQRSSVLADRERDSFRLSSSLGGQVEERERLVSEGWEKSKMKGRRSGMKSDATTATAANGALEGEREYKWGTQPRLNVDGRSRPSEGHGFRSGPVHGIGLVHKVETSMQQNGLAMRSVNKNESDGSPSIGEKRDRFVSLDKERLLSKNGVKSSHREESHLASPSTITKAKAARAPRSSSGVGNPPSQAVRASSLGDVWDRPQQNKVQLPVGPTNRKRPTPTRSSSPPVAQWVGQRPQKMARVARRMNLVPPVGLISNRDEALSTGEGIPPRDGNATGARSTSSMSTGSGFIRKVASTATLSQSKPKSEKVTATGLSESDESEGGDVKSKEKGKKHGESEGKFAAVSQKMGPILLPAKKSRAISKEEGGDGIRRQGRTGRALVAMRGNATAASSEKVDVSENQKQLRSAKPGLEKTDKSLDIKPGRPPTKKGAVDRKAFTRPRRPVGSGAADLSGESDDDHEDLVVAVQAAVNASAAACSSNFWKQMEPYFIYLTQDDYEYLRQQVRELEEMDFSLNVPTSNATSDLMDSVQRNVPQSPVTNNTGKVACLANGSIEIDGVAVSKSFNNLKDKEATGRDGNKGINGDWLDRMLPLSQRLLAALIIEGDSDEASGENVSQDEPSDIGRERSPLSDSEQAKAERRNVDLETEYRRCNWGSKTSFDDFSASNGHRYYDATGMLHSNEFGTGASILVHPESDLYSSVAKASFGKDGENSTCIGPKSKEAQISTHQSGTWNVQYQRMNINERILLELQSIGLFPEPVPDLAQREDDDIGEEIKKMQLELKDQVFLNKERIQALETVVSISRESEARERERLAMTKLVEIAYARRVGCRGGISGSSGSKSSGSKGARAAALVFAKRMLARWKNYIETGQSCFTDSGLRNILFCISNENVPRADANGSEAGTASAAAGPVTLGTSDSKSAASENAERLLVRQLSGKEKTDKESSDSGHITTSLEQAGGKDDFWASRTREREVLLEDVVCCNPIVESTVLGGTKGKRSERERDVKGQNRECLGRSDANKGGRPGLGSIKGERKTKTKPRQKTAPLLKAVNGLMGNPAELPKESNSTMPATSEKAVDKLIKGKGESLLTSLPDAQVPPPEGEAAIDLSHLQLPGMEDLVVTDDLSGQGQDLGSWLDFEDPGLQDASGDFVGLDVPMDDLSDLAMMM